MTVPLDCEQLPCEGVADSNVTPAGSVSVSVTPVALEGPPLCDVRRVGEQLARQHRVGRVGLGQRQVGCRVDGGLALAELLPGSGSTACRGDARLVGDRARVLGVTLIVDARVLARSASVPSVQVTVPLDSEQLPCEGVADSKVTPAGRCR